MGVVAILLVALGSILILVFLWQSAKNDQGWAIPAVVGSLFVCFVLGQMDHAAQMKGVSEQSANLALIGIFLGSLIRSLLLFLFFFTVILIVSAIRTWKSDFGGFCLALAGPATAVLLFFAGKALLGWTADQKETKRIHDRVATWATILAEELPLTNSERRRELLVQDRALRGCMLECLAWGSREFHAVYEPVLAEQLNAQPKYSGQRNLGSEICSLRFARKWDEVTWETPHPYDYIGRVRMRLVRENPDLASTPEFLDWMRNTISGHEVEETKSLENRIGMKNYLSKAFRDSLIELNRLDRKAWEGGGPEPQIAVANWLEAPGARSHPSRDLSREGYLEREEVKDLCHPEVVGALVRHSVLRLGLALELGRSAYWIRDDWAKFIANIEPELAARIPDELKNESVRHFDGQSPHYLLRYLAEKGPAREAAKTALHAYWAGRLQNKYWEHRWDQY